MARCSAATIRRSVNEAATAHTDVARRRRSAAAGRARQRAYMIAALPDGERRAARRARELLRTAGVAGGRASWSSAASSPHPNTYLGPGKLEELKDELARADANLVACDDELSPRQERNLEAALGVPVIDRTAIILDIFAAHAHTAEGKLQVELAQLEYNLARMRGLWSHLERLGGRRSAIDRGPGETQIETDRRLARDRISALKRKLAHVRSSRSVMRAERERAHLPQVALAGYTNAGKSTLLNALTGAEVGCRRPPVPHARPDHPRAARRRPRLPADRHRRIHPQAPAPAGRRVRRDARGDAPGRPDPARRRRLGARGGAARR